MLQFKKSPLILAFLALFFIAIIGFLFKIRFTQKSQKLFVATPFTKTTSPDEPPLFLKNIGINLDYYNPQTGRAGDLLFTKQKLQFNQLFTGFGFVIPGNMAQGGKSKASPQPTFIVPLGTPVRSLIDGVVVNMPTLWSGDYSIQVTTDGRMQQWIYETEHVRNPKVRVGDRVRAGQVIAEVGSFGNNAPPGFGAVEIGILKGGNPPYHVCPFVYLDPSIKEMIFAKIKALYTSWEEYRGDTTLYNNEPIPGCLTLEPIEG